MPRSRIEKYPTGIRAIFYKNHQSLHTTTVYWTCPVGSIHEKSGEYGMTHLLEHFFFKGSAEYPSAASVADAFNRIGAVYNAFTYKYKTTFYIKVPNTRLTYALSILNDILCCARFPRDEFEKEKSVVMEEIRKDRDSPYNQCEDEIDRILFHGTPYAHSITGTLTDIRNITYDALCAYKRRHYIPKHMFVSIITNMNKLQINRILTRMSMFSDVTLNPPNSREYDPESPRMSVRVHGAPSIVYRKKPMNHTHIMIGISIPYPVKPLDNICYKILAALLGGNSSSRLFRRLREQHGISYSNRCEMSYYPHVVKMQIYTSVEPSQYKKAYELIMECLRDTISESEFELARGFCKGREDIDKDSGDSQSAYDIDEMMFPRKSRMGVTWGELVGYYNTVTYRYFHEFMRRFYKNKVQIIVYGIHS